MIFYLTFGQKSPARNGWIEIEADSLERATVIVERCYGRDWSMLYEERDFKPEFFPSGCIGRHA